jgi:hypothetical protein
MINSRKSQRSARDPKVDHGDPVRSAGLAQNVSDAGVTDRYHLLVFPVDYGVIH